MPRAKTKRMPGGTLVRVTFVGGESSSSSSGGMSREELDSLTVVKAPNGRGVELRNSSGVVGRYKDRDAAYAEVRRLRKKGKG